MKIQTTYCNILAKHNLIKDFYLKYSKRFKTQQLNKNGKILWTYTSSEKMYRWQIGLERCSTSFFIRELHIKITTRYCSYLLEWVKSKKPTITNVDNDLRQQELLLLLVEMEEYNSFRRQLVFSYKAKHSVSTWLSSHVPRYLSNGLGNLHSQKELYLNVSNFIYN